MMYCIYVGNRLILEKFKTYIYSLKATAMYVVKIVKLSSIFITEFMSYIVKYRKINTCTVASYNVNFGDPARGSHA